LTAKHSSPDAIVIDTATPADADAADAITREAFAGVGMDHAIEKLLGPLPGLSWQDLKARQVRREIAVTPGDCFVARAGGQVVGYVTTRALIRGLRGQILNLAVAADHRDKGIGRMLLDRAVEHFRARGFRQVKIETLVDNEIGSHLYPAVGFREVTRQIHYVMEL
jgi:ribosomal protein S18 acetylase RimI-like enzyme